MLYQVKKGDSPAKIARMFGVPMGALIGANRHKPTKMVAGQQTWQGLRFGETVRVPPAAPGMVGDFLGVTPASASGSHPLIKRYAGNDPAQVALAQSKLGIAADGVFGAGTESAVKAFQSAHGLYSDGIVGPSTWAALLGTAPPASIPAATHVSTAPSSSGGGGVQAAAAVAAAALVSDPNYCTSVARSGTPVNSAIHNFKAAWNAANPGQAVPINTGKYEPVVASALSSALGGAPVPPGCGGPAAAPMPPMTPMPIPTSSGIPAATPVVSAANVAAAVAALARVDPCYSGNAMMVCAAQAALGITPDGKYGPGTAAAVQRLVPGAPPACGPVAPLWWGKKTDNKCTGGSTAPSVAPSVFTPTPSPAAAPPIVTSPGLPTGTAPGSVVVSTATPIAPAQPVVVSTTPGAATPTAAPGSAPVVVAPTADTTKKGLSTGALVAGGLGAAALVGVAAMALSKKGHGGGHQARRSSGHKRKSSHKKRR